MKARMVVRKLAQIRASVDGLAQQLVSFRKHKPIAGNGAVTEFANDQRLDFVLNRTIDVVSIQGGVDGDGSASAEKAKGDIGPGLQRLAHLLAVAWVVLQCLERRC